MGNACSCVSKNKKLNDSANSNNLLSKEGNDNQIELDKIDITEIKTDPDLLYADTPVDFEPDIAEPVDRDLIPLQCEIPNVEPYDIPTKKLDDLAISIGKHCFSSFLPLIYHLIYNRVDNTKCNDYEKVCALFTWLTTKNLHDIQFSDNSVTPDSPEEMLMGVSTGKTAYAQAFQMLCRYAGLQCKLIRGYAKGIDYKPGMKLDGVKEAQHAWNAVKMDNIWYLFDCHWAARRLMGKTINSDRIKTDLDLFYYMTNPLHLRYTHFPYDEEWQLSKEKISLEEFEKLTLIKPAFFKYDLELYSHTQAVLDVQNELILMIKVPIDLVDKFCVTFTLTLEGLGEIYEGSNLTRYGIQDINKKTGICTLNFRFPKSGSYKLLLYAREFGAQVFGGICEYRVNAKLAENYVIDFSGEKVSEDYNVNPYPPAQQPAYGKTEVAYQYNVRCSLDDTFIYRLSDGIFEVSFLKENEEQNNFPRLMGRLKSTFHDDSQLNSRILQRNTYDGNVISKFVILAFLPDQGEYALEIYANNPDTEGTSFFLIWQLFISTDKGSNLPEGLHDINPGAAIGSQQPFQELGLTLLSHPDPYIIVPTKTSTSSNDNEKHDLVIDIGLPPSNTIKILGQLVDVSSVEEEVDFSDYLLQQSFIKDAVLSSVSFCLRFPKSGSFYKLHIYAASANGDTETLPMVFSYIINVPHRLSSFEVPYFGCIEGLYPYQLSQWKDKCRLIEPMNRNIKIYENPTNTRFSLQVADAFYVAVVILGENWNQLSKTDEISSTWSGNVSLSSSTPVESKITVCACYNESITSYTTILEYYVS